MALVIKVAPKLPAEVNTAVALTIKTIEKGGDWQFVVSYVDADGIQFGKPQTFILNSDGITLSEQKGAGKQINWVPPANGAAKMADAITYCQAILTAINSAGALNP